MKNTSAFVSCILLASCVILAGCASTQRQLAFTGLDMENMLEEANFVRHDADTSEKLGSIKVLPQGKVVPQEEDGVTYYVYADADGCLCIYTGDSSAFIRFENIIARRGAQRSQCIDDRLRGTAREPWRAFGPISNLCSR